MRFRTSFHHRRVRTGGCLFGLLLLSLVIASSSRAQSDVYVRWVNLLNPAKSFDRPAAMVVDGKGNTYVTGTTCVDNPCADSESLVAKYDFNGTIVWKGYLSGFGSGSEHLASGLKIGLDGAGNVYVLSVLNPNNSTIDIALAKFSPAGIRQWVDFIGSTTSSIVNPGTLAVAPDGSTYISYSASPNQSTVCNAFIRKYDMAGRLSWSHEVNPTTSDCNTIPFLGLDAAENVYALFFNFFSSQIHSSEIVKYNSAGTKLTSFGGSDLGTIDAFRVDAHGNSYVAGGGSPQAPHGAEDRIVAKYDASGTRQWIFDSPAALNAVPAPSGFVDLSLDSVGNVFAAQTIPGVNNATNGGTDISIIKFSATGTRDWTSRYNGRSDGSGNDKAVAVVVNSGGNAYITGVSADPTRFCCFDQIVTIKYDPSGKTLWAQRFRRAGLDIGSPVAIAISGGDLIVAGLTEDGTASTVSDSAWTVIDYVQDAAKVSPTSLTFGSLPVRTQSSAQSVTLTNTAETPLEITGIDITGDFQLINDCPATLAPGASCTFKVTFTPTATGTRTGSVTVHDNWSGSISDPQTVKLTGTGVS